MARDFQDGGKVKEIKRYPITKDYSYLMKDCIGIVEIDNNAIDIVTLTEKFDLGYVKLVPMIVTTLEGKEIIQFSIVSNIHLAEVEK